MYIPRAWLNLPAALWIVMPSAGQEGIQMIMTCVYIRFDDSTVHAGIWVMERDTLRLMAWRRASAGCCAEVQSMAP